MLGFRGDFRVRSFGVQGCGDFETGFCAFSRALGFGAVKGFRAQRSALNLALGTKTLRLRV